MPRLSELENYDPNITKGKVVKWVIIGIVAIGALGVVGSYVGMFTTVATAPSRIISKTMDTNNIINNYEWFHDANAQYKSRLAQANEHKQMLASATDNPERNRLSVELSAIRQSCRDLSTRYNANATKSNRSIFMGTETPNNLSLEACER